MEVTDCSCGDCSQFTPATDGTLNCGYCGCSQAAHTKAKNKSAAGSCTGCGDCDQFSPSKNKPSECDYCGCPQSSHTSNAGPKSNVDGRGIARGACTLCDCDVYEAGDQYNCLYCGHKPPVHKNMTGGTPASAPPTTPTPKSTPYPVPATKKGKVCAFPGCGKPVYVEGTKVHDYCGIKHAKAHQQQTG